MVLVAVLALVGVIAGVVWLATWAWGLNATRPMEPRRLPEPAGRMRTEGGRTLWPALIAVVAVSIVATLVLRARGLPVLLMFLPFLLRLAPRRRRPAERRCRTCGEPIPGQAEACAHCGAS